MITKEKELNNEYADDLEREWDIRLKMTQPSFRTREPILNLRRALLELHGKGDSVTATWRLIAKAARTASQFQTAETAIMRARLSTTHRKEKKRKKQKKKQEKKVAEQNGK